MPRRKGPDDLASIFRRCQRQLTEMVRAFCSGHPAVMLAVAAGVAAGHAVFREQITALAMEQEVAELADIEPGAWVLG